jgi:hypothetical protein
VPGKPVSPPAADPAPPILSPGRIDIIISATPLIISENKSHLVGKGGHKNHKYFALTKKEYVSASSS